MIIFAIIIFVHFLSFYINCVHRCLFFFWFENGEEIRRREKMLLFKSFFYAMRTCNGGIL